MKPFGRPRFGPALRALALSACVSLAASAHGSAAAERITPAFLPGMADVPLMRGLDVEQTETIVFDKPDGRIVAASAVGPVAVPEFVSYYASTLPQLGWRAVQGDAHEAGELSFRREGETLRIEFAPRGRLLAARFLLAPD